MLEMLAASALPNTATEGVQRNTARIFHSEMLDFQNVISTANGRGLIPSGQYAAWVSFRDSWAAWYGSTNDSTWTSSDTVDILNLYITKLDAWKTKYAVWTGISADPLTQSTTSPSVWMWLGLGAIAVAGYYWSSDSPRNMKTLSGFYSKRRR